SELLDPALDVGEIADRQLGKCHVEHRRRLLDGSEPVPPGAQVGVVQDRDPGKTRCDLLEQLQPLASKREKQIGNSSYVATGTVEACDKPGRDRIANTGEYDRNRPGQPLQCCGCGVCVCHDHVGSGPEELLGCGADTLAIAVIAKLNFEVAALEPAKLLHALAQRVRLGARSAIICTSIYQDADPSHPLCGLCSGSERPKDRCAQYSQAFPASYVRVHHGPPGICVRKTSYHQITVLFWQLSLLGSRITERNSRHSRSVHHREPPRRHVFSAEGSVPR